MDSFISERHPLRTLFTELVQSRLLGTAQMNDIPACRYIAGLLVDFCHVENLYKVRNSKGKRLEEVGEMLLASNPLLEGDRSSTNGKCANTSATTHCFSRESSRNT